MKDLQKVRQFMELCDSLPRDAELRYKVRWGKATEEEKQQHEGFMKVLGRLMIGLEAFIEHKFGEQSSYMSTFNRIRLGPNKMGLQFDTNQLEPYNEAWRTALIDLKVLLQAIEAKLELENEDNELEALKLSEEKRLKAIAGWLLAVPFFSLIAAIIWFFVSKIIDWQNAKPYDFMTWIDPDKYARIEGLQSAIEGILIIGLWGLYLKIRKPFASWYYEKQRVKSK